MFLLGFLALQIIGTIYIYSQNSSLRYRVATSSKELSVLDANVTDLEKQLYNLLDLSAADQLISEFGLVKDSSPEYIVGLSQ